jgi:hypothetical protein
MRIPMLAVVFFVVGAGCSVDSSPSANGEATSPTDGAGADGPPSSTTTATPSPTGTDASAPVADAETNNPNVGPVRFHIALDYRFDTGGFFTDPIRRKTLEGAARTWGRLLSDSFPDVPANTYVFVKDPTSPYGSGGLGFTLDTAIDDLIIFVGSTELSGQLALSGPSAGLSGVTDQTLADALDHRYSGSPFQPWTGWMSFDKLTDFYFDPTPDTAPHTPSADKIDFFSIALHEMGHVLGFGTAAAFKGMITTTGAFKGAKASAAHGSPVLLESDKMHVPNTLLFGGKRLLMNVSFPLGTRYSATPLDQAFLEDLGSHF